MTAVVLASTSATRASILRRAGLDFQVVASGVEENEVKSRLMGEAQQPATVARALAALKAAAVSKGRRSDLVIGADQTLECDGALMDKAASVSEARAHLRLLRGRGHRLHSAVALAQAGRVIWETIETASLFMRPFSDVFLDRYLAREGKRILGSVGCYRLEGRGAQLFDTIEGDYFAILGLPLLPLLAALWTRSVLAT